ncbi:MAG: DUF4157 domain-containing protein [Verrucomicrobia bacterium]|nr:DUF4157 domain-containing protein [Verrucomicrobiota bacterium]
MDCDSQASVARRVADGRRLADRLRRPLERCFGTDFAGVRVHVGRETEALGALAFAYGEDVFVAPPVWLGCPRQRLRVLAHEFAHVVQQRQGRTGGQKSHSGFLVVWDPALEAEAERASETVLLGRRVCWSQNVLPPRRFSPVIQPLVSVNGELVKFSLATDELQRQVVATNLSQKFVRTLNYIAGSLTWLDWAVNQTSRAFAVADELTLVQQMLEGLHNVSLLRMPSVPLVLHPAKLWDMSANDFLALTDDSMPLSSDALVKLLAGYGLRDQNALDEATQYFRNLVDNKPALWASLTLDAQTALDTAFLRISPDPALKGQIGNMMSFAALKAADAREFADCCWFYLTLWENRGKPPVGPASPALPNNISALWDGIHRLAVRYLDSPSFGPGWRGREIRALLRDWIEMGGGVGFQTASSAAFNIARYSTWLKGSAKQPDTEEAVTQYVNQARALIYSASPVANGLTQDGLLRRFTFQKGGQSAVLAVDSLGTATLETFVA